MKIKMSDIMTECKTSLPEDGSSVIVITNDGEIIRDAQYDERDGFTVFGYDPCDRIPIDGVVGWVNIE